MREIVLTVPDLLRAAEEGVIAPRDVEALLRWARAAGAPGDQPRRVAVEGSTGLNWVSVAYYGGALLMIGACAWFLGDKWEDLGPAGIFVTSLAYAVLALSMGLWLRDRDFPIAGGLLVTVAVALVPLMTYCIERLLGAWPGSYAGPYTRFAPPFRGAWIVMELTTIAASAIALRYVRFGFLTAPIAVAALFLSMDLAEWLGGSYWHSADGKRMVAIGTGGLMLALGYALDRSLRRRGVTEDYPFWCYLFGLAALWGGLTTFAFESEPNRTVYALANLGLIAIALWLRRATFLVFGAIGIHLYLGYLAYEVFGHSVLFPFALALLGLSLILVTVWSQRRMRLRYTAGP
jgi:hypothetical protein